MDRLLLLMAIFVGSGTLRAADSNPLAVQARAVLDVHCHRCHGENGVAEGGLNYILDLDKLVARKKVVAGKPEESPLLKRIVKGSMPPPEVSKRLSEAEVKAIEKWIEVGAPSLNPSAVKTFLTAEAVNELILADLEKLDRRSRRFQRYFSLHHLQNAGLGEDELQTYRNALSKLINSLSWHPKIRKPEAIDPQGTLFRIDLRWYMWDATLWNRLLQDYPYGLIDDSVSSRLVAVFTGTKIPLIRGDWFIATASRPLLYQDLLQLPGNLADLERQLRVDANLNIAQERVMRVAFNGSGISKNNRVLERHDAVHGYYWRTYDFDEVPQNLLDRGLQAPDRRNVFAYPLGPGSVENTFQHAGGEAIFSLPNGLQGYYIMNEANNRLNKAPTAIVSDPKRPDKAVELGISCMGCHSTGILVKADQMHDHLESNPKAIAKGDAELALSLYPKKEKSLAQMEEDSRRFVAALEKAGIHSTRTEPIIFSTLRYEGDLDAVQAAAEVGLPLAEFQKRVGDSSALSRPLGSLRIAGGMVARQVWVQSFGDIVRELHLGTLFQATQIGTALPDNTGEVDPLEVSGQANQVVFSADGRRAVIASGDRSVRYYEVEGQRDLKRFVGHTASVWSVALSSDGRRILSGSMDGSARLWDIESGQQLFKLDGHTGLVTAVAFSPDGTQAISGGLDGYVILWDLKNGDEILRWRGPMKYVTAVAVLPDGKRALIAADRVLRIWDLESGKQVRALEGHASPITSLDIDANGKRALSGSDDQTARLWNLESGKEIRTFKGSGESIRNVRFSKNGQWFLIAGSNVQLWKIDEQRETAIFRKHANKVVGLHFAGNGIQTVSADRDGKVYLWSIGRWSKSE
jgi:mono/diheme cytochrome c family protein